MVSLFPKALSLKPFPPKPYTINLFREEPDRILDQDLD